MKRYGILLFTFYTFTLAGLSNEEIALRRQCIFAQRASLQKVPIGHDEQGLAREEQTINGIVPQIQSGIYAQQRIIKLHPRWAEQKKRKIQEWEEKLEGLKRRREEIESESSRGCTSAEVSDGEDLPALE
ncbi:hypothetical protein HOM50_02035 [bacterium]|nr:hypothetical protein [bacterium]MBT5015162.1 hypothetical protein [bacterium]